MSEELRPCPFCGEMPKVNDWSLHGITEQRCFCDNDKCPVYLSKTIAICDWNTRPIEDALTARIAELEAEIERFTAHSDIERQDDKCSGHGDISNFPPVMGSGDGLGW